METVKKGERSEGLTLLELMVALAIFAIIVTVIIFYLMRTSQYTGRRIDVAVSIQQGARLAMEQLTRELRQAGYRRVSNLAVGANAASSRSATSIEFEADLANAGSPQRIAYKFEGGAIQRRQTNGALDTGTDSCGVHNATTWDPWNTLAENVTNFNLTYFFSGGSSSTPTCTQLQTLSRIRIELEAQVTNAYPGATPVTVRLLSEVQTRNSGIFGGCDNTAPAQPATISVSDTCLCTRLNVSWAAVSDADLAGYTIFVGTRPNIYDTFIDVGKTTLSKVIDQNNANLIPDVKYYIGVAARDTCGNLSTIATVDADRDACGGGTLDTKPSPMVPETVDVTGVTAVANAPAGPGQVGTITLTWPRVMRSGVEEDDLSGYRVYRSATGAAGSFTCIRTGGTACDPGNTASVTVLYVKNQATYTFTDNDPNLIGCNIYFYQIVAVNCRNEGTRTASIHGDGDAGIPGFVNQPDFPAGANTAPRDETAPPDPTPFIASPGAQEVYLTFRIPTIADVPDFDGVLITYSTVAFPPESVSRQRPAGDIAFEGHGLARIGDMTVKQTGLTNGVRYYYRAFAIDRCGNYSPGAATTSSAQPCNDGATGPPTGPWYHGTPNPPTLLSISYCQDRVYLTWAASKGANPLDGVHNNDIPDDLAKYWIYRDNVRIKYVGRTDNAVDSDFDPNAYAGAALVYQITAEDCVPNESIRSNSMTAYPGSVIVDLNNEDKFITRGIDHNEFYFLIRNTSAALATIDSMTLTYDQTSAFVQKVDFFNISTIDPLAFTFDKTAYEDFSPPGPVGAIDKGTGNEIFFTDKPQLAGQGPLGSYRVVRVVFTDTTGTDTSAADMRGASIKVRFSFTLGGTSYACGAESSYFIIPTGPVFSTTEQQPPSSITFLPSVTLAGSYVVPGQQLTNVQTFITTDSYSPPIALTATLYWATTSKTKSSAPFRPLQGGGSFSDPSVINSGSITMTDVGGSKFILDDGSNPTSRIPIEDGKRVWYYIFARDGKNNINNDPSSGAFTYDQAVLDPCSNTPKRPATLNAVACSATSVQLSWSPVTQNTDDTAIKDLAGYKIYKYTDSSFTTLEGGFPVTVGPVVPPTSPPLIYNDTTDATEPHYYKVTAFDTCTTPKESGLSAGVTSPVSGSTGSASVTAVPNSVHPYISGVTVGDAGAFRVTIVDPTYACNTITDVVWAHVCTSPAADDDWFRLIESGDTGVFNIDSTYYGGRDYIQAIYNGMTGPVLPNVNLDLGLGTNKFSTLTVCWDRASAAGSEGTACTPCVASATVTVTPDPCLDTPNAPAGLSGSRGTGNSRMNMSWTAPTTNTDSTTITDLYGFNIYRRLRTTGPWILIGQVSSGTTSVSNFDVGVNLNTDDYYFKVTAIDTCSPPKESADSNIIGPF